MSSYGTLSTNLPRAGPCNRYRLIVIDEGISLFEPTLVLVAIYYAYACT